ncbi:FAD dependent oxidoreductase [Dactylonectria estremocensis]|uniref:FAD dependent oxidoreductase n=1 Tax=Dactylonectria estremocensis TaxID=1079267 RepID=A0A9P9FFC9_9HYPO|nr:FAD dependent oxidoreductase [Dactylonectria estremocensis]
MSDTPETVLIVGAGIVGSALAHFLSTASPLRKITVTDRSLTTLVGSTGHAPGFVGQFNESEVLTRLAMDTVIEYTKIPSGFNTVGGLEVAHTASGIDKLEARHSKAASLGLPGEIISIQRAVELAPDLVKPSDSGAALHFSTDGTANAGGITSYYQESAQKAGVQFLERDVTKLIVSGGRVTGVEVRHDGTTQQLHADKVILATGIWAQDLCKNLDFPIPVVPVGHPYMHGERRKTNSPTSPFVRWPEAHVYARDHGDCYGIGTYNHKPVHYQPTNGTAIGNWVPDFESPVKTAISFLPEPAGKEFQSGKSFNGIFSMTPDNMPLAGKVKSVHGLYLAVAVWVTHAAGTAKFIARMLNEQEVDQDSRDALQPERFRGQEFSVLQKLSLCGYNEIYKTVGDEEKRQ